MACLHLVKDGVTIKSQSITESIDVTLEELRTAFGGERFQYFEKPPRINQHRRSRDDDPYLHVVLEIFAGEESEEFPTAGYYKLTNVSVQEAAERLGRTLPRI